MLKRILTTLLLIICLSSLFAQDKAKQTEQDREVKYYLIEAKSALSQGNIQEAISLYNKCILKDKSCGTAHYELANIAIAVKDMDVALQHSRAAVAIAPNNGWFRLQLAEILESRGMFKQAAETYVTLAKLEDKNAIYLQKSITLYETLEEWDKALKVYDLFEEQYGTDFNILVRKQALYSKLGKQKAGLSELKKLLKKEPLNSEYHSLLAMHYTDVGDEKKAEKAYKKLASLPSISGVAQMILARYYMGKQEYPNTYKALKKSIESGEVDEQANVALVINLLQNDTTKQANNYRDTLSSLLVEKYPYNVIGYLFKAQQYGELENHEDRKKMLDKALEIDPSNYNGLAQLCVMQNIQKEWGALYETAKEGIKYYPQEYLFYLFKGLAASQKKEFLVAESSLETSYLYARENQEKEDIHELLADVYYKSGKTQKAFDLFEEILKENKDNLLVMNNYSYFLSLEQQDLEKAEEMSRKTIEKEPKNATYLDTYAWILFQQKKYREALEYIEKAIENLEDKESSSEMWEHYGDILFKLGKKEQAVKEWEKALKLTEPDVERLEKKITENK